MGKIIIFGSSKILKWSLDVPVLLFSIGERRNTKNQGMVGQIDQKDTFTGGLMTHPKERETHFVVVQVV